MEFQYSDHGVNTQNVGPRSKAMFSAKFEISLRAATGNGTLFEMTNSLLLNMAIEIVDFPMKHGDFPMNNGDFPMKNWWISIAM